MVQLPKKVSGSSISSSHRRFHSSFLMNEWMNEFLEQLVRGLTNAYSRSQKCLVSVYHLAPQISEAFSVFLAAGGKCY